MARKKKRRYRFRAYMLGKHYYWDVDGIYLDEEQTKGEGAMPTVSIDTSLEILDADASAVAGNNAVNPDRAYTCLLYTSPSPRD